MTLLKPVASNTAITVPASFDLKKFFQTRDGLYVWNEFTTRILAKAKTTKPGTTFSIASYTLEKYAADDAIESDLPKDHLFSVSDVCALIAELISKQPKGEDGILVTTGRANLFYTTDFVVGVHWAAGLGLWYVGAYERDDYGWGAGGRVFAPAAISGTEPSALGSLEALSSAELSEAIRIVKEAGYQVAKIV